VRSREVSLACGASRCVRSRDRKRRRGDRTIDRSREGCRDMWRNRRGRRSDIRNWDRSRNINWSDSPLVWLIIIQEGQQVWRQRSMLKCRSDWLSNCGANLWREIEGGLIKDDVSRDNHLACFGIIESPSLVVLWVTNEDALSGVRGSLGALISLHMHIGNASPGAQVRYIWFRTVPHLIRRLVTQGSSREAVCSIDKGSGRFTPPGIRETRLDKC
jgi:hypothetical protein